MKIETLETSGFIGCLESLRLPFKKEVRSTITKHSDADIHDTDEVTFISSDTYTIGLNPKDLSLLQALIERGDEHAKALRMINTTAKIQAPLFWWSEMDTYEIGVVNGCSESTMHTLLKTGVQLEDFENGCPEAHLNFINEAIKLESSVATIKGFLPSGYLQTRVINFSYQTLRRIIKQRTNHKLPQWKVFIDWCSKLPLAQELLFFNNIEYEKS